MKKLLIGMMVFIISIMVFSKINTAYAYEKYGTYEEALQNAGYTGPIPTLGNETYKFLYQSSNSSQYYMICTNTMPVFKAVQYTAVTPYYYYASLNLTTTANKITFVKTNQSYSTATQPSGENCIDGTQFATIEAARVFNKSTTRLLWCNFDIYDELGNLYYSPTIPTIVNILTPQLSLNTGLSLQVPYSFNISNLKYDGTAHIGIKYDTVIANEDIVGADINISTVSNAYSGKLTMDIGAGNYIFYVDYKYNDGAAEQIIHAESKFSGGMDNNHIGGQDVVTGNPAYNNMIKFSSPSSGQLYGYGQANQYAITADKSYFDSTKHIPLEQYLPPVPEETGNYQQDAIAKEARIMANIVLNGEYNDTLKFSIQELWQNDITKPFPWFANQGLISTGKNSLAIVSQLYSQSKTDFYNYELNGKWRHIYAGVEFYIGEKEAGVIDPSIPNVGGSKIPLRTDYPDGILGAVQYGFDTLLFYVTFPFQLLVEGLTEATQAIKSVFGATQGLVGPIGSFLEFLPPPLGGMIIMTILLSVIIAVVKFLRK